MEDFLVLYDLISSVPKEDSTLKMKLFLITQYFMVNLYHLQHMEELRSFPPKIDFLAFRCTRACPSLQTPATSSLRLVVFFSEMVLFFLFLTV